MDNGVPSTAGRRQFNDTALAKLMAEGVPRNVANAFINHGIDKSGRYTQLRDHVCKMEYSRYLIPRSAADYADPTRVGQLAPYVVEQKLPRFFTEFAMSDIEAARFTSCFPEFNVIPRGTTYNQHGFYANKRYAEAELLVGMVHKHAARSGSDYDPRSLVDVGGNEVWHAKRDRTYVHNDNPVLSARDMARYVTREVFSGATGETTCNKKFSECTHKAQYGIAVHSSYDFSPRALATGMCKRDMDVFFLVMNVVPGLSKMKAGQYEVDGMVVTLHRPTRSPPTVSYTFKHDLSLEYSHPLYVHDAYLMSKVAYDVTMPDASVRRYVYRIVSMRGNTLVATMERTRDMLNPPVPFPYAAAARRVYYLTIRWLDVRDLEVDCEFFDRLVLTAAGSRGAENYDILSLYKYAKSLRQRVSINGIVLSSGYTLGPEHLVTAVIAAYSVAAAYRIEGARFFQKASSQIHSRRGQGLLRDLFDVAVGALLAPFALLGELLAHLTFYKKADLALKAMVSASGSVQVVVDKPHAGAGAVFRPEMLKKSPAVSAGGKALVAGNTTQSWITPLTPGGWAASLSAVTANCAGSEKVFLSYSLSMLDKRDHPVPANPIWYDTTGFSSQYPVRSEEYRAELYSHAKAQIVGSMAFDDKPLILPTGDRLYRKRTRPIDGEVSLGKGFDRLTDNDLFIVFRGVGDKAVSLGPPPCYGPRCIRFVLFYTDEVSAPLTIARRGGVVHTESLEVRDYILREVPGSRVQMVKGGAAELQAALLDRSRAFGEAAGTAGSVVGLDEGEDTMDSDGVRDVDSDSVEGSAVHVDTAAGLAPRVVGFADHQGSSTFVEDNAGRGEYYMTGALPVTYRTTPPRSVASTDTLVYSRHDARRDAVPAGAVGPSSAVAAGVTDADVAVREIDAEAALFDDDDEVFGGNDAVNAWLRNESSVSSSDIVWGKSAMEELVSLCDAGKDVALASSAEVIDLAVAVARGGAPFSMWGTVVEGKQGSPLPVKVVGGVFKHAITGGDVDHMAVSDGCDVFDRVSNPPPDGLYVTSDVMRVYTGGAIRDSVRRVLTDTHTCAVTNVNGVAGCGKTYTITHEAKLGDVVLCETRGALEDTAARLSKLNSDWDGAAWTVDSFLLHAPRSSCNTLWIDESLRLHAGKVFAVIKMLKPVSVYCFGDGKQIPVLPFIPGFDFLHHEFPFTTVSVKRDTYRSPADVCFVTSQRDFYGFHVRTHNPVLRSIKGPELFRQGMFHDKPDDVVLLTYTQVAKLELIAAGVRNVMTIGESQGSTIDKVMLFRDSPLGKPLYNDLGQSLVALTRHRKEFTYVSVAVVDTSVVACGIRYLRESANDLLLASHSYVAQGVFATGAEAPAVASTASWSGYDTDWSRLSPAGD